MIAFLTAWGTELLFGATTVIAGLVIRHYAKKMTDKFDEYKQLVEDKEAKEIETQISNALQPIKNQLSTIQTDTQNKIDAALIPIRTQIAALELEIKDTQAEELKHLSSIRDAYRFRLMALCDQYLDQGYMTTSQYKQLSEMYKIYTALGGNGQAKGVFEKTCNQLEIIADDDVAS